MAVEAVPGSVVAPGRAGVGVTHSVLHILRADVDRGGKQAGVQHAELKRAETGTLLLWTVTMPTGRLTRRLVAASCKPELEKWLASVDRQPLAHLA